MKNTVHLPLNRTQSGFTLVELLVGVTVGILVLGAIGAIFVPALATYRNTQAVSTIQENTRFAIDRLDVAVDQAGFFGCDSTEPDNMINVAENFTGTLSWVATMNTPVRIAEPTENVVGRIGGAVRATDAGGIAIGDVLTLLSTSGNSAVVVDHDLDAETISFRGNVVSALGDEVLMLNDCRQTTMFNVDGGTFDGTNTVFSYAEGDTENCGSGPDDKVRFGTSGATPDCSNPGTFIDYQFRTGVNSANLTAMSFYIGPSSLNARREAPVNSLYSILVDAEGNFSPPVELAAGVDNFRARYGVRGSTGKVVYVTAGSFAADPDVDGDSVAETVQDVVAIEANLMLSSIANRGERGETEPQEIFFPDLDGTMVDCSEVPSDAEERSACPTYIYASTAEARRYRRVLSKTFTLRNVVL